jgi:hypothetical protein
MREGLLTRAVIELANEILEDDAQLPGFTFRYAGRDFRLADVYGRGVHDLVG